MDDDKVWSGFSMTSRRNVARAIATVLGALVMLTAALQGTALAAGPALTIAQPESPSANQTPVFNGTTNDLFDSLTSEFDPVTLDIYKGPSASGSPVQTWTAEESVEGAWEITPTTPLPQGEYTAAVEQTNWETGTGTSDPVTFTIETLPVVTLTSPEQGAVLTTSGPTLTGGSGSAPWDGPVTVTIHEGSVSGTIVASGSASMDGGSWFYTPHLNDGIYTAQASQGDEVGQTGDSPTVSFTVDAHPPAVTLTSPEEGALVTASDPTLTGLAAPGAWDEPAVIVTIHEGGSLNGEVIALEEVPVSAGAWGFAVPHLSDGIYTAQASQGDEAGHTGTSNAVTFTVDTAAPVVTLTSPTAGAFVKTSTPTLSGQGGAAPWDASRLTVKIHEGSSTAGSVAASSTTVSVKGGAWSYVPAHLSDGTYTAQAEQADEAGHNGLSSAVTFTVDTTPPALTLATPENGEVLATSRPTFSGLAGHANSDRPLVTVKLYKGSSIAGSPSQILQATPESGSWTTGSEGPALPNGTYTALAEQSDEAGNRAERTATFTIATISPSVTLETPGFEVREGNLLAGTTPSFSGSGGTEPEDSNIVTVKIYGGASASGAPIRSIEGSLVGSKWKAGPAEALPDGVYTAQAEQADKNPFSEPGVSTSVTFTVDTSAPVVALTTPTAEAFLNTSDPTLSGAAGAATWDTQHVTISIHKGESLTGELTGSTPATVAVSAGTWSYPVPHLLDGTYTAIAEQGDEAGHEGKSIAVTFTIDTTPPALTLETPEDGQRLATSRPTFSGLAGHGRGDRPVVTVKLYRGGSVSGSPIPIPPVTPEGGTWTTGPIGTQLSDGTYTAVAEQFNEAGGHTERVAIFTVEAHPPPVTLTSPVTGSTTSSRRRLLAAARVPKKETSRESRSDSMLVPRSPGKVL